MRTNLFLCLLVAGLARAEGPATPDQAISDLNEHHRHHHHGGITQFVAMSLDTLGEEEAHHAKVEQLEDTLHACMDPVAEVEAKVFTLIADGLAAGAVDAAKVKAGIEQVNTAADTIHGCVAGPMNQLHEVLSPPERAELGDKVLAHWDVWRQENHDADPAGKEAGSRLADLAKDLSLTPEQVDAMAQALKKAFVDKSFDVTKVQGQVRAFATAFAGEKFDATKVTTHSTGTLTAQGMTRAAVFYQTVTAWLKPEQRTALAAHLREHANHHAVAAAQ